MHAVDLIRYMVCIAAGTELAKLLHIPFRIILSLSVAITNSDESIIHQAIYSDAPF